MTIKAARAVVASSAAGAVAGFVTRPCCVGPAVLSVVGVSSVGLAELFAAHRAAFVGSGAAMLIATMWITFRRDGGCFNKSLAAVATLVGFAWSMRA